VTDIIYDRFADALDADGDPTPPKDWDRIVWRAGLGVQAAELNEVTSISDYYLRRLGLSQFPDGSLVSGAAVKERDIDTGVMAVSDGYFFIQGKVRKVTGATFVVPAVGTYHFGLKTEIVLVYPTNAPSGAETDQDLVDPAQELENAGLPGALRQKVKVSWEMHADADPDDDTRHVYEIINGILNEAFLPPSRFDLTLEEFERRTYEFFGHFKLYGFTGAFIGPFTSTVTQLKEAVAAGSTTIIVKDRGQLLPNQTLVVGVGATQEQALISGTYTPATGEGAVTLAGTLDEDHTADEIVATHKTESLGLKVDGGIGYVRGRRVQMADSQVIEYPRALDSKFRRQSVLITQPEVLSVGASADLTNPSGSFIPTSAASITAGAPSATEWGNEDNAKIQDQNPAVLLLNNDSSSFLRVKGFERDGETFGDVIPSTATIRGIEVTIVRGTLTGTGKTYDHTVRLQSGGDAPGDMLGENKAKAEAWKNVISSGYQQITYGGPEDLWGLSPGMTQAQLYAAVTDADFGVRLAIKTQGDSAMISLVDALRLTVYYSLLGSKAVYQLDQPFVKNASRVVANVDSPIMRALQAASSALLTESSVYDPYYEPHLVVPSPDAPASGSAYALVVGNVEVWDSFSNATGSTPTYEEGVDYTLSSGDQIEWITGPGIGQPYFVRWTYNTDNGNSQAALKQGSRIRTILGDDSPTDLLPAVGSMPSSYSATQDVAVPLTFSNGSTVLKDVFKINKINVGVTVYVAGRDYVLDSGRRFESVDQARIIWKAHGNRPSTSTQFQVHCEYWAHAPEGDYLSAGSYFDTNGITQITDRAILRAADDQTVVDISEDIADAIDFRPLGRNPVTPLVGGPNELPDEEGASTAIVDYDFFLPRMDALVLAIVPGGGIYKLLLGSSSASPQLPAVPDDVLPLLYISSDPAATDPKLREAPSTRFTVADQINILRRLENLEVAVLTSLLEQSGENASNTLIKRGLFTDPFKDFTRSDLEFNRAATNGLEPEDGGGDVSFDCALQPLAQAIRMPFELEPFALQLDTTLSSNVHTTGNQLLMLKHTEKELARQRYATKTVQVNPGLVFKAPMVVELTPSVDFWLDDAVDPIIVVPIEAQDQTVNSIAAKPAQVPDRKAIPNLLRSKYHGYWKLHQTGVRKSDTDLPLEFAPAAYNRLHSDGRTADGVKRGPSIEQGGAPIAGSGLTEAFSRMRQRSSQQPANNEFIVSHDILPAMRQELVQCSGKLFPAATPVRATFGGVPISLTPTGSTAAGTTPGTIVTDTTGAFTASFTVPSGQTVGTVQVVFSTETAFSSQGPVSVAIDPTTPGLYIENKTDPSVGSVIWSNKANAETLNGIAAGAVIPGGQKSQYLFFKRFSFAIPTNATITGVVARVTRGHFTTFGKVRDLQLRLFKNGSPIGTNKADTATDWPQKLTARDYGGRTDTWGATLTPADFNTQDVMGFGIAAQSLSTIENALVDAVEIIVYYTNPDLLQEFSTSVAYVAQGQIARSTATYASILSLPYNNARLTGPIAQTIFTREDTFLTSLDLYFATKDAERGLVVEIRNVESRSGIGGARQLYTGNPGGQILGRAVLTPADVTANGTTPTLTRVRFTDPVFLRRNEAYAIVLQTDSDAYRLWVAQEGSRDISSGTPVTKNAIVGDCFISLNQSLWSKQTDTDLMFTLWGARIDADTTGIAVFRPVDLVDRDDDPFSVHAIVLSAPQLLPDNTSARWELSVDAGQNWIPIEPGVDLSFATVFSNVRFRTHLATTTAGTSPAINRHAPGFAAYVNGGDIIGGNRRVGQYITFKNALSQTFNTLRTVIDEHVPAGTDLRVFYSANDGAAWIPFPISGSLVQELDLGNDVIQRSRNSIVPEWDYGVVYLPGQVTRPSGSLATNGHFYRALNSGSSHLSVQPSWNTVSASITQDNGGASGSGLDWEEVGPYPWSDFRVRIWMRTDDASASPQAANLRVIAYDQ